MEDATNQTAPSSNRSILGALKEFFRQGKLLPKDVVVVFLAVALLGIFSRYFGSRAFFRSQYYETLYTDMKYMLYEYLYGLAARSSGFSLFPLLLLSLYIALR